MKILVCVRSVPDLDSSFAINPEGTGYVEEGLAFGVNEYDMYAMEEAVRIKESLKDVAITVLSAGPERAEAEIKKAMALGADSGARIDFPAYSSADALETASLIAAWAGDKKFDLVMCGVMSEDLMRCQTGPMLAQLLGMPCATTVVEMSIREDCKGLECARELETGTRERVFLPLPALVTIQSGINTPRYASLSNVLRVKKTVIPSVAAASLGTVKTCRAGLRSGLAPRSGKCEFIEGDAEKAAEELIDRIRAGTQLL